MIQVILLLFYLLWGFSGAASGKEPASQCWRPKRCSFNLWVRKILLEEGMPPLSLPGESHGQRSLVVSSP